MAISTELLERSAGKCEMCGSAEGVQGYTVPPKPGDAVDDQVALCTTCLNQVNTSDQLQADHWRCLNDSIWSPVPAVQALAYRTLTNLSDTAWASDLRDMMYLDEETLEWAHFGADGEGGPIVHKDSNGHILQAGDTVVLIKDLNVKGANFTAKRGTAVRRIRLDPENANHIEGKVDGQQIVILTQYVKKS